MATRARVLVALSLLLTTATPGIAQPTPNGELVRLDSATPVPLIRMASLASLAMGTDGRLVATWVRGSSFMGVRGGSAAHALGPEQALDGKTGGIVSVALQPDGTGLVVWSSRPGLPEGIRGQRVSRTGQLASLAFQIDTSTTLVGIQPDVAVLPDGAFLVTWAEGAGRGWGDHITGQRLDLEGSPLGVSFRVDLSDGDRVTTPTSSAAADGSFVVAWTSTRNDASTEHDLLARRFDSGGASLGAEIAINSFTTGSQVDPHVQMLSGGGFLVAWTSDYSPEDDDLTSVQLRRFSSDGSGIGAEMQVNTATTGIQAGPGLAPGRDGTMLVVWEDWGADPPTTILARGIDAQGSLQGGAFVLDDESDRVRGYATVASSGLGDFLVAWSRWFTPEFGGSEQHILARRVSGSPPIFEDGFNDGDLLAWGEVMP